MHSKIAFAIAAVAAVTVAWSPPASATCIDAGPCVAPTVENPRLEVTPELSCLETDIRVGHDNQAVVEADLYNDCQVPVVFDEPRFDSGDTDTLESKQSAPLWDLPGSRENHDSAGFPGAPGEEAKSEYAFTLQTDEPTEGTLVYRYEVTTEQRRSKFHSNCNAYANCPDTAGYGSSGDNGDAAMADAGAGGAAGTAAGCNTPGPDQDSPPLPGALALLVGTAMIAGPRRIRRRSRHRGD